MKDITNLMIDYRECSRNIWNTYFGVQEDFWELEPLFEQINKLLFEAIVLNALPPDAHLTGGSSHPTLSVVPFATMRILIRRPSEDGNQYWDQEPDLRFEEGK